MARMAKLPRPLLQLVRHTRPRPLDPQYVSSVDSGNLAGHLIALANACREWSASATAEQQRLPRRGGRSRPRPRRGAPACVTCAGARGVLWRRLDDEIERLASSAAAASARGRSRASDGSDWRNSAEQAAILADTVREIVLEESDEAGADLQFWADAVGACIESHRRDLGDAAQPRWTRG